MKISKQSIVDGLTTDVNWIKKYGIKFSSDKDVFKRNKLILEFISTLTTDDIICKNIFKIIVLKEICFHHVAYTKLKVDKNYLHNLKDEIMMYYNIGGNKEKINKYLDYITMKLLTNQTVLLDSNHISDILSK